MVHLSFAIDLRYDVGFPSADFIFNLQAARTRCQHVLEESLMINQHVPVRSYEDPVTRTRIFRLNAVQGPLLVTYRAKVEIDHFVSNPSAVFEIPVTELPDEILPYLYPSRYCQSDRFATLAMAEFGLLPRGYQRVEAIQGWVRRNVKFQKKSSTSVTSAIETFDQNSGVCRDFAHLMIALCRALSIPARYTTGIDYGADPALGPTDFHAYVEVYLSHRWFIFDPAGVAIPMGFVRLGTGRDASDASFATIFGDVTPQLPMIQIGASRDPARRWELPVHRSEALSTD